jgi:CubicO group peptidase (beta-lactamase class C family)
MSEVTSGQPDVDAPRGAVLLRKHGRDLVTLASGQASDEAPNSVATRFQIASVSKQFTCAAILALGDRGELDVHDPVSLWLDGIPDRWKEITLHHLMTHTSGLLHWPELPQEIHTRPPSREDLLAMFMDAQLFGEPGTAYRYSSPAYVLLAIITEHCAGMPYQEVLHREVFEPVGMHSTFAGDGGSRTELALGYRDGAPVPSMALDATDIGAGDVWSTVSDLVAWDRALVTGTFLSDDSRHQMLRTHVSMPQEFDGVDFDGYGYGWCIGRVAGHRVIFHTGGNFGYRSINAILPDDDAFLAVLSNEENADLESYALQLLSLAIDERS